MDNKSQLVKNAAKREVNPTVPSAMRAANTTEAELGVGRRTASAPISSVQGREEVAPKKAGFLKKGGATLAIVGILLVVLLFIVPIGPAFIIGTIKENLIGALGFKDTIAILEKQGEYITSQFMAEGKMPDEYGDRLAAAGIETGQINSIGGFVRTNTYIANIDDVEVAAEGNYYTHGGDGELVVKFGEEIVTADNFVAAVEASPTMYAAYSDAANLSALYYHGEEVEQVLNRIGVSGGSFNSWSNTGDSEADMTKFREILDKNLDKRSNQNPSGQYTRWDPIRNRYGEIIGWTAHTVVWECSGDGSSWICHEAVDGSTYTTNITGEPDEVASGFVSYVAAHSRQDATTNASAEENAAQIINSTVSADEPYRAASTFMSVMEAIERAQVDGDGPVNEMMEILSRGDEVTYRDVNTGETVTSSTAVIDSYNFYAAVSDGEFSKAEANNFSRDSVLMASNASSAQSIKNTSLSSSGKKKASDGLIMNNDSGFEHIDNGDNSPASMSVLAATISSVQLSLADDNSSLLQTVVGANRVLEGGSFISNTVNQQALGAAPSDAAKVISYHQETQEVIARQAEADRATRSPFDISSPNTFMGSLVRKVAIVSLKSYNSGSVVGNIVGGFGDLVGQSSMVAKVLADDEQRTVASTFGDCDTVPTTGAVCDPYGTQQNTPYTGKMELTTDEWREILPAGSLNSNNEIIENGPVNDYMEYSMDRNATIGVRSYDVCQKYNNGYATVGGLRGILRKIVNVVTGAFNLVDTCDLADQRAGGNGISTGANYVLRGDEESEAALMSGYMLHDQVKSMLSGEESQAAKLRRKLYGDDDLAVRE